MNAHAAIPESFPALVLNADFRPLSYYPLSLWSWQESVKAVFLDRVNIVSEYDRFVRSPSFEMRLPSVVSLKTYVKPALYPAFTRFNVFLRDRFSCQYCGAKEDLTFDHLIPRSRGGQTRWDNVVAACAPCNLDKGGAMPDEVGMLPEAVALPSDGVRTAPQRPAVPAQLPAPELARLSLLGYRTRALMLGTGGSLRAWKSVRHAQPHPVRGRYRPISPRRSRDTGRRGRMQQIPAQRRQDG